MSTKEILNSISATLMQDERILSANEKELLVNLIQHAGRMTASRPELSGAVRETIERAVGETLAQRAYGILGNGVLQRLQNERPMESWRLGNPPTVPPPAPPPGQTPRPPGPSPIPPGQAYPITDTQFALGQRQNRVQGVGVLEPPEFLPARMLVLDEFLAPEELQDLLRYTLAHEAEFRVSEIISPGVNVATADFESRRSHVLMELDKHHAVIVNRIQSCLPRIFEKLEHEPFPLSRVEAQITASNDGDFFRQHSDNAHEQTASRELTFVYFFHREPKKFRGGELRIYDSCRENGGYSATANYRAIVPQQNQTVFFPSSLVHEITPVECAAASFPDSRFTVNGWLRR
jgi:Rps23 Pro-64 3,4-dihydroxylase Tpa1-like proline 4-hydroxylase